MRIWIKNFNYHENKGYQFFESEICTDKVAMSMEKDFESSAEFASMYEIKKRDEEIAELKAKLKIAKDALEFYGKENTWLGLTDKVPFDVLKWIRVVEDDMDNNSIGGKKAREALKEIGEV